MKIIELIQAGFEISLLFTAFLITTHNAVKGAISYYRIQSLLLAFVTGAFAADSLFQDKSFSFADFRLLLFVIFLPLVLGFSIKRLLERATIQTRQSKAQSLAAERVWLQQTSVVHPWSVVLFLGLVGLSTAVAFGGVIPLSDEPLDLSLRISLLVSISLFLTGLLNTASKSDIISQVVGLLTMDHGLYLAVVTIVNFQFLAGLFIAALWFYTLITVAIIVVIVPQVRQAANSIDLDTIARGSDLEG